MPLADFLTYQAGYVPHHDVDAQLRCYHYLEETIALLDELAKDEEGNYAKNRATVLRDVKNMVEAASGSLRLNRATTFWKYWDKNKVTIISEKEGTDDDYAIQDKIGQLEEGRYFPN